MLLIYTLDTTFTTNDAAVPLTVITLGLSPNQVVRASTTASAVLMGTRNGYVYAVAEVTKRNDRIASAWTDSQAIDDARRKTETQAFEALVSELEKAWADVVRRYG